MNEIVRAAIAEQLGQLERVEQAPTGELGYGRDVACTLDADADLSEVDPLSPVAIGQALFRRLVTRRGTLPDDRNYGLDVRAYCNRGTTDAELRDLAGQVRNECTKDDRVETATVTATTPTMDSLTIAIRIKPAAIGSREFTLTLAVLNGVAMMEVIGG